MAGAGVLVALGIAGPTTKSYSFWVDGLDLVGYMDWPRARVEMRARAGDSSRASFTLQNIDGTLDFSDRWGKARTDGVPMAYPLIEVRLYDHVHQEPLFGGYIVNMRTTIMGAVLTTIELECVGYSWLLEATFLPSDLTVGGPSVPLSDCIQSVIGIAGLRDGIHSNGPGTVGNGGAAPSLDDGIFANTPITLTAGTSVRSAIMQLANATTHGLGVYVDNWKRLVVVGDSLFDDTNRPVTTFGSSVGTEVLEQTFDFADYASNIYIDSTTAAGRGWYGNSALDQDLLEGITGWTYAGPAVDARSTRDDSTTEEFVQFYGLFEIISRQLGMAGAYRLRKSGLFGWRLYQSVTLAYPQLSAGNFRVVIVGYTLTFERPDWPVFDLEAMPLYTWGSGNFASAVSPADSTAVYQKRKLVVRNS
jgi:hypothetical protein